MSTEDLIVGRKGGFFNPRSVEQVLVLFPLKDWQTGLAISKAFAKLGREVTAADPVDDPQAALAAIDIFEGELIFCGRELSLAQWIEDIRVKHPDATVASWNVDARDDIRDFEALFPLFRRSSVFYTVAFGNVDQYRAEGINAFWLPQGLQEDTYKPPESLSQQDIDKYACEVSFIGHDYRRGLHAGRTEVLDAIEKSGLDYRFWGCRGSEEIWNEEVNKAAALSQINLAHSGWPELSRYMSVRAYKLMAAGGFVLANWHRDMDKWIPCKGPTKALDYYKTPDECLEKIRYYLEHPEDRKAIAQRGMEWAASNTYTERMQNVLDHVEGGKYYFHHYVDTKDCHRSVDEMRTAGSVEATGKCYVATVATMSCLAGVRSLAASIKGSGHTFPLRIYTDQESLAEMEKHLNVEAEVELRLGDEWYKEFLPQPIRNRDARYLKPWLINDFEEGDRVLFIDGADAVVYGDIEDIFEQLDQCPVILTPAEQDRETTLCPGFSTLFKTNGIQRYNSGVWAFRKCAEADAFFNLWKAFCGWSLHIGHGDQLALMKAASQTEKFGVVGREWNWLPDYGEPRWLDDKPFTPEGGAIRILHQAGQ